MVLLVARWWRCYATLPCPRRQVLWNMACYDGPVETSTEFFLRQFYAENSTRSSHRFDSARGTKHVSYMTTDTSVTAKIKHPQHGGPTLSSGCKTLKSTVPRKYAPSPAAKAPHATDTHANHRLTHLGNLGV